MCNAWYLRTAAAAGSPVAAVPEAGRCKLAQFMWRTDVWGREKDKGSQSLSAYNYPMQVSHVDERTMQSTIVLDLKKISVR